MALSKEERVRKALKRYYEQGRGGAATKALLFRTPEGKKASESYGAQFAQAGLPAQRNPAQAKRAHLEAEALRRAGDIGHAGGLGAGTVARLKAIGLDPQAAFDLTTEQRAQLIRDRNRKAKRSRSIGGIYGRDVTSG